MSKSNTRLGPLQESPHEAGAPDVSIVIVSWNVRALLVQCLHSIASPEVSKGLSVEVLVVDNASSDGSVGAVQVFPTVKVIALDKNIGYGRANNLGLKRARGRYILILNPDTVLLPGSLAALIEFADATPDAGIISPRLLNVDSTVQPSAFRFPTLLMAAIDLFPLPAWVPGRVRSWLAESYANGRYKVEKLANQPFQIEHPLGACLLIKREAYEQVAGFDPRIFMYSEEIDLAMRFARAGWGCWQVPSARVVHLGGQSTGQAPLEMQRELWRSRLYIYRKHKTRLHYILLRLLLLIAQGLNFITALIRRVLRRDSASETNRKLKLARTLIKVALTR